MTVISRRQTARRWVRWFVAAMLSFVALGGAMGADELAKQCAARDLQILTIMEQRADASAAPGAQLRAEMFVLQQARNVCALHLIPEALAVYDRVILDSKPISAAPTN